MTVRILTGDMRERLRELPSASVDAVVTDPPYHLTSIVKRFGQPGAAPARAGKTGAYARASKGFMGQTWDGGDVAFRAATWREVLRVMKPGAHLVAFSGTRTYHRMVCAIEDAGFEIRDQIAWLYGSGFPKSHDVSKGIDRHNGDARPVVGSEHIANDIRGGALLDVAHGTIRPGFERDVTAAASAAWEGWGTALKPAIEPIVLARKPLEGTVAANVLAHGTGALNIDACRIDSEKVTGWAGAGAGAGAGGQTWNEGNMGLGKDGDPRPVNGRWPANVIHDGGADVLAAFPGNDAPSKARSGKRSGVLGEFVGQAEVLMGHDDEGGSAARFFYSAKADQAERHAGCHDLDKGNKHPTVKPVDLMRWLVRLITPPGGVVLDPFMGSGSTLIAADAEQFDAIGCELSPDYVEIARRRLAASAGMFAEVQVA